MTPQVQHEMEICIQECLACHRSCLETVMCALLPTTSKIEAAHIQTLLACAELCQTAADLMLLNVPAHIHACAACAELCEQCARLCEQQADNALMKNCAEVCCRCVESCYYMAGIGGLTIPAASTSAPAPSERRKRQYDKIDQASAQSFPASDPPGR